MARSFENLGPDLQRRLDKLERDIERSARQSARKAGNAAKDKQNEALRDDAGGNLRLSRVGRRGAAIGTRVNLVGDGSNVAAQIKAKGPVHLLANPTAPHDIWNGGGLISMPGIGVRRSADHPGTPGKDSWNKGRKRAQGKVSDVVGRETDEAVRRSFTSGT